jgi:hypothetical protein
LFPSDTFWNSIKIDPLSSGHSDPWNVVGKLANTISGILPEPFLGEPSRKLNPGSILADPESMAPDIIEVVAVELIDSLLEFITGVESSLSSQLLFKQTKELDHLLS